jgi:Fic family protein
MPIKLYDSTHQFEPLLPSAAAMDALSSKAHDIQRAAAALVMHPVPTELRELLRGMNSYYTNRIEGQHTRPLEISQALNQDFSSNPEQAAKQRLALTHMAVEREMEARIDEAVKLPSEQALKPLYEVNFLQQLHQKLFSFSVDPIGRSTQTVGVESKSEQLVSPAGLWRTKEVSVGLHIAPSAQSLPQFLQRWSSVYCSTRRGEAALLAMAASHQRLAWIHPFPDGNGRVIRLHTHLLLYAMGLSRGLWSPLRGFARSTDRYYALLSAADQIRQGDLDGRGNLSEKALVAWMDYVLDICLDQIALMQKMLKLDAMRERLATCLHFEQNIVKSGVRIEALSALHYLWLGGHEFERGSFKSMLGLGDRVATGVLAALLNRGLLKSDTPLGKVRFGVPLHSLRFYFPALWPEAEADVEGNAYAANALKTSNLGNGVQS